ncbi:MAG: hypothetical protein IKH25_12370 [Muribaculaceae bacterium]|nr:hypothetical protein [Muribaculaceae bacterium]
MQRERVDFELNARRVSTAVKRVFQGRTRFSSVGCDDEHFIVEGRRGWLISPLSERVKMRVVATGTNSCQVIIESSSRSVLNLFNLGANSRNVTQLGEFIRNEVYRVSNTDENIRLKPSEILIRKNNIRFKQ